MESGYGVSECMIIPPTAHAIMIHHKTHSHKDGREKKGARERERQRKKERKKERKRERERELKSTQLRAIQTLITIIHNINKYNNTQYINP